MYEQILFYSKADQIYHITVIITIEFYKRLAPHFLLLSRAHRVEKNHWVKYLVALENLPKLSSSLPPGCV